MARIKVITTRNRQRQNRRRCLMQSSRNRRRPNFLKVFAQLPDALKAFLGLHGIANGGSLDR